MNAQVQAIYLNQTNAEAIRSGWNRLYQASGAAALISALFFPIQIIVFFLYPYPNTVNGWFTLFQEHPLAGLLDMDLLLMVEQALAIVLFLALFVALKRTSESYMTIGTGLGLASTVLFIASNPAFQMLFLSSQYASADTEAQRAVIQAAGQAMLAMWQGSAFQASYLLGSLAAILISLVMLRSDLFSKATAYFGILANGMALGLYVPGIGIYISIFSVLFLWIWYLLMARRFFQLGRSK